jgi:hypothetical protein
MSTQTIGIPVPKGTTSKVWLVVALAVTLIVTIALMGPYPRTAGDSGRSVPALVTAPSHTIVIGADQAQGHPLP